MAIALIATIVLVPPTPGAGAQDVPGRAAQRAAPPGSAHHGPHRALLQLGLLHAPRLRAVPMEPEPHLARATCSPAGASSSRCSASSSRPGCTAASERPRRCTPTSRCSVDRAGGDRASAPSHRGRVIVATIVAGAFIGINNTLTTQAVMMVSPVERPVASAAYGFVRFIGGGLAPYVAGKIAEHYNIHVPFCSERPRCLLAIAVCPPVTGCWPTRKARLADGRPRGPGQRRGLEMGAAWTWRSGGRAGRRAQRGFRRRGRDRAGRRPPADRARDR